jgi:N-carbamoylputrescine amidase
MVQNKIRIAAIQTSGMPGKVDENLSRAEAFIRSAAAKGAQLAVLPKLSGSGYFPTPQTWNSAESIQGRTFRWMSALSRELSIWLGAGIVETDGEHIYNTYLLTKQDGDLVAAVREHNPKVHFWRPGKSPRVIKTSFGILGLAICAKNHCQELLVEYLREGVNLVLMPHAWFIPAFTSGSVSQKSVDEAQIKTRDMAFLYSRVLGVPAVFVNHAGPYGNLDQPIPGLSGEPVVPDPYHFPGFSTITDGHGQVLAQLEQKPGYTIAQVTLDPAKKNGQPLASTGWDQTYEAEIKERYTSVSNSWYSLSYSMKRVL